MCRGELSSAIRKNREGKPPLPIPYDERFVAQLEEFLPHLRDVRFNGGEPFLHDICFDIWDRIAEVNPGIEITVATNGTVVNKRVRDVLPKCRFRINVSIDALDPGNYERIRKNGRYKTLMRNVEYLGAYCREKDRIFSIMINPMRQNWWEMPDFVDWCSDRGYHLWFNTVTDPEHCSLMTWDAANLEVVYRTLSSRLRQVPPSPRAEIR